MQRVCVLILVDEDVSKLVVVFLPDFRNLAQKPDCLNHQIVEVESVVRVQPLLVHLVNSRHRCAPFIDVFRTSGKGLGVFAAVLGRANRRLCSPLAQVLLVVSKILDALFDQSQRIVLVVDGKCACVFVVELLNILTENPHT